MKHTFKALLMQGVLYLVGLFFSSGVSAQNNIFPELEGTWVLDSIQVKEIMPDSIFEQTVLSGDDINFSSDWMWQLTFATNEQLLYTYYRNRHKSSETPIIKEKIPYTSKNTRKNTTTLIIDRTADYRVLEIQLISKNTLLITHSFSTQKNDIQDIDVSWNMYYHKSN